MGISGEANSMRLDYDTRQVASTVNNNTTRLVRKVILDGLTALIRQSPVDTGRFKANWSTSMGISSYRLNDTMFLTNNLEYAMALEFGHSGQAPRGWIRNTTILIQNKLDEIRDLI